MRGKILTTESKYRLRSREANGKESRGFAARIGGSAAIASRWPRTRDIFPPATQAILKQKENVFRGLNCRFH